MSSRGYKRYSTPFKGLAAPGGLARMRKAGRLAARRRPQVAPVVGLVPVSRFRSGSRRLKFGLKARGATTTVPKKLEKQIRKVICKDGELKGTSFESYYADIVANGANSWTRELNGSTVYSCMAEIKDHIILGKSGSAASAQLQDAVASKKIVAGDSQLKNREGGVIYPKRLDLMFTVNFGSSNTYFKCDWVKIRVWVVQQKANTASTAVPAFNMWMSESAANEVSIPWSGKALDWFDPRKKQGASGASQFKVLKKIVYTVKADSTNKYVNMPFSDTTPLFGATADFTVHFKSIDLSKAGAVKYTSDTSGDPDTGNVYLMIGAWNSIHTNGRTNTLPLLHCYSRLMYVENKCD